MSGVFLFILFLVLPSCRQAMTLHDAETNPYFRGAESTMVKVQEEPWKVGHKRDKQVTKSLTFSIETPVIEEKDALLLLAKFGIDSWVFRIVRIGKDEGEIGHFYIQFVTSKDRPEFLPVNKTMVQLIYAAAYISERFREFKCPAFEHRKRLADYRLEPNGVGQFILQTFPKRNINAKPELSYINPAKINIGNSLLGIFEVQVALYNSSSKEYFGEFRPVTNRLIVERETEIDIPECNGVKEELNEKTEDRRRDFKFGR